MSGEGSATERSSADQSADQIVVVSQYQKELASVEREFSSVLATLKGAEQDLASSTLEHVLVLDSAAEATQDAVETAVAEGMLLIERCLSLNAGLRGIDKLAERVKQLKLSVEALDHIVDTLTLE